MLIHNLPKLVSCQRGRITSHKVNKNPPWAFSCPDFCYPLFTLKLPTHGYRKIRRLGNCEVTLNKCPKTWHNFKDLLLGLHHTLRFSLCHRALCNLNRNLSTLNETLSTHIWSRTTHFDSHATSMKNFCISIINFSPWINHSILPLLRIGMIAKFRRKVSAREPS